MRFGRFFVKTLLIASAGLATLMVFTWAETLLLLLWQTMAGTAILGLLLYYAASEPRVRPEQELLLAEIRRII